jgi:hypothetical protein
MKASAYELRRSFLIIKGGNRVKKTVKRVLIIMVFVCLAVIFSAVSCSVTPTPSGYILQLYNSCGAGIVVWLRIFTAPGVYNDAGPYANGVTASINILYGYEIMVWNSTNSAWMMYDGGGDVYTITSNTSFYIQPGILGGLPYVDIGNF